VLGVERRFAQDAVALERRYKELARASHPDRFARADAAARRAALRRAVALNEAWKTLKDPARRAEYLLSLAGIEVASEQGTVRTADDGSRRRTAVPAALLGEVLELREALHEARAAGDDRRVAELARDVEARRAAAHEAIAGGFGREPPDLEGVTEALVALRYWDRFVEEVEAHEEAADAGAKAGGSHGG
jgi:molecular chaperone HscB